MGINEKFLGVGGGTTCICDFPSGAGGIALYQLNTNANDTCGNYNANSETNITYSAGKFGNAAQFNGTSSNIEFPAGDFTNTTVSVSAWIYSTSNASDQNIFCNFDYIGGVSRGFIFRKNAGTGSGVLEIQLYNGAGSYGTTTATVTNNVWTHVVVTIDTTGAKIYIDGGTPFSLTAPNAMAFHTATTRAGIGSYRWVGSSFQQFFDGGIDQVRIYNSVLTSAQVTELYNETVC